MFGRVSPEVEMIREGIDSFLNLVDEHGRRVCDAKFGIYAFYDYDDEPIYVGQTREQLRTRIRRHLTNQRTDAVAMNVLDPFEVASIEVWPFWDLVDEDPKSIETLNRAEYTVYKRLLAESKFGAVLNEKPPKPTETIELPPSYARRIIPDDLYYLRSHPDVRIARRASTLAQLAKVVSERSVSMGLRRVLVIQARRLEYLARERLRELSPDAAYGLDVEQQRFPR